MAKFGRNPVASAFPAIRPRLAQRVPYPVHVNAQRRSTMQRLLVTGGMPLPYSPIKRNTRTRRIRVIRIESEVRLTVRESQSQGFGAWLDVREGSRPATTL